MAFFKPLFAALVLSTSLGSAAPGPDVVRLSQTVSNDAQIADAKGFFTEQNIKINWTGKQAHGPAVLVTVAAGENDFAGTISSAVFLARARGSRLKIIAAQGVSSAKLPFTRYLVKDNSPIRSAQDFIGKKVAAQPTTISWYPLAVYLKDHGVDYNKVEFVHLPSPLAGVQALAEGKVDVLAASESGPPGSLLLAKGGFHFVPGIDDYSVLKTPQFGAWAAREDFLAAHPDLVRRFVKALARTAAWANAHPEEAQHILNRLNEVPPDLEPLYHWRPFSPDLLVDPGSIRTWTAILERFGQIQPGSIRPDDVYTNQFNPAYRSDHT